MSERTPLDTIEKALSDLSPGEKAHLLQKVAQAYPTLRAEDLVNARAYAQLHPTEIEALIDAHEVA